MNCNVDCNDFLDFRVLRLIPPVLPALTFRFTSFDFSLSFLNSDILAVQILFFYLIIYHDETFQGWAKCGRNRASLFVEIQNKELKSRVCTNEVCKQ